MLFRVLLRLLPSHERYHGLHLSLQLLHVLQGQIFLLLRRAQATALHEIARKGYEWLGAALF